MAQFWDQVEAQLYHIEPDGDRGYTFCLVDLARLHRPQRFLARASSSHILLTPLRPAGKPYLFDRHAVLSASRSYVQYVCEKTGLDADACAAIILATGWLIQYPGDISGATRRARLAPALLAGKELQQEAWDQLEEYRVTL